jgi:hypothetical protein
MDTALAKGKPSVQRSQVLSEHVFYKAYYISRQETYPFTLGVTQGPSAYYYQRLDAGKKLIEQESSEEKLFILLPPTRLSQISSAAMVAWPECYRTILAKGPTVGIPHLETASQWTVSRPVVKRRTVQVEKSTSLFDAGAVCLLALATAALIAGLVTGIWPVALAGLGPGLLALLDIGGRKWRKKP